MYPTKLEFGMLYYINNTFPNAVFWISVNVPLMVDVIYMSKEFGGILFKSCFLIYFWTLARIKSKVYESIIWPLFNFFISLPKVQSEGNNYTNNCQICFLMPYSYKLVILLRYFMAIKIKKASRFWGVLSVLQISSRCPVNGTLSDLEFKLTGLVLKFS